MIRFKLTWIKLEFMFMKHYAPNRCEPGGGGIRADVSGEVKFL